MPDQEIKVSTTISKSAEIVRHAINSSIPVFTSNGYIAQVRHLKDSDAYELMLGQNCHYRNLSIKTVAFELTAVGEHTRLLVAIRYALKKSSLRWLLQHFLYGRHSVKKATQFFLNDFKKRIEKWL